MTRAEASCGHAEGNNCRVGAFDRGSVSAGGNTSAGMDMRKVMRLLHQELLLMLRVS